MYVLLLSANQASCTYNSFQILSCLLLLLGLSYYVSLYFVNVLKRTLAFIPFNLNFFDNGLCSVFMEQLKAYPIKNCQQSLDYNSLMSISFFIYVS